MYILIYFSSQLIFIHFLRLGVLVYYIRSTIHFVNDSHEYLKKNPSERPAQRNKDFPYMDKTERQMRLQNEGSNDIFELFLSSQSLSYAEGHPYLFWNILLDRLSFHLQLHEVKYDYFTVFEKTAFESYTTVSRKLEPFCTYEHLYCCVPSLIFALFK